MTGDEQSSDPICLLFERITLVAVGTRGCREDRVTVETERHLEARALIQIRNDGGSYQGHS